MFRHFEIMRKIYISVSRRHLILFFFFFRISGWRLYFDTWKYIAVYLYRVVSYLLSVALNCKFIVIQFFSHTILRFCLKIYPMNFLSRVNIYFYNVKNKRRNEGTKEASE